jgi:putative FmdB family regulatory protein
MPLYEYYCPPCGIQFEVLRPMSQIDNAAVCPSGHTTNNRVLSLFAPVIKSSGLGEGLSVSAADHSPMAGGDACCGGSCCC